MRKSIQEYKKSGVMCLAPWMSAHTFPNGDVFPCCVWDCDHPIGNINDKPLPEIWNDEPLKDIRKKMLNDEEVQGCKRCYTIDMTTGYSLRNKIAKDYPVAWDEILDTKDDGEVDDMKLRLWDFRLSNFCNLRCRSCGPDLSSSWFKDSNALYPKRQLDKALITVNDKVSFMDMIKDQYQYVEEIYFAGGEPLSTPEHFQILEELIRIGNTDIRLRYSTNFTNLTFKGKHISEYWKHFSHLEVLVSLDGVGVKGEYIRKGLDYDSLIVNLKWLNDSNIKLFSAGFVVTYGVMNYLDLFDIVLDFIDRDLIDLNYRQDSGTRGAIFSPIYGPDYYDCRFLPDKFKTKFKLRLDGFFDELIDKGMDKDMAIFLVSELQKVYNNSLTESFSKHIMNNFVSITRKLDQIRKEKFQDLYPEFTFPLDFITNEELWITN